MIEKKIEILSGEDLADLNFDNKLTDFDFEIDHESETVTITNEEFLKKFRQK